MAEKPRRGLSVLVCSDQRYVLRLVQVNLERQGQGYEVATASTYLQALDLITSRAFKIAVVDGDMPGGREVASWIKTSDAAGDIPVMLLEDGRIRNESN